MALILERDYRWGMKGGRVSEQSRVMAGATIGAVVGAVGAYLFFTERGHDIRERIEPAVDDLKREFARFQKTIEKVGEMANDGLRVMNEFNAARSQGQFSSGTSH
jgi:gas vesicle protein